MILPIQSVILPGRSEKNSTNAKKMAEKIRSGEKITNSELRKALAAFSGGNQDQEG